MCVTEALDNIQAVTGTLTSTELETLVSQGSQGSAPNLPNNVTCSDCTKQAYNLIQSGFPGVVTTDMQNEVSQTCGASFIDGSSPSDVSETANTATQADTTSNGSPAQGMSVFGVALSSLFAASSAFALLA
ncbi:hypothetical protein PHLCEN_2v6946 [Hermanssonia centrifuga]|uniref:Uncharacterized protein n=2 Tax=Hermanssonia centrifuga TaxID=98765 RepID=A0A2R6NY22_9APHY|nr:hypothetical protein PHLCEN_2v6946 [Hermanssonia centrifuga]